MVLAGPAGKIRFADATGRRWLSQFFSRPAKSDLLPRRLRQWLAKRNPRNHRRSLVVGKKEAHLCVREQSSYTDDLIILLLELIKRKRDERARHHRGLTLRENEVLFWLQHGKSNAEIGAILGIASATVAKHLERIYPKLGVDNRTAASHCHVEAHR